RSSRRVTSNLVGRGGWVPQWNQAQWHETTAGIATPLFDHPVVVRANAQRRESLVLRFEEELPAESRDVREAQRSFGAVEIHVAQTLDRVVATGPHLFVGDRIAGVPFDGIANARDDARNEIGRAHV